MSRAVTGKPILYIDPYVIVTRLIASIVVIC